MWPRRRRPQPSTARSRGPCSRAAGLRGQSRGGEAREAWGEAEEPTEEVSIIEEASFQRDPKEWQDLGGHFYVKGRAHQGSKRPPKKQRDKLRRGERRMEGGPGMEHWFLSSPPYVLFAICTLLHTHVTLRIGGAGFAGGGTCIPRPRGTKLFKVTRQRSFSRILFPWLPRALAIIDRLVLFFPCRI